MKNPFRYRGYVWDAETEPYYLGSRYYDAEVGRFLNPDVSEALLVKLESVYDCNLYLYCDNNPIIRVDIDGKSWDTILDIVSIAGDIASILANPTNVLGYAELAADVASLILPGITGGGQLVRIVTNSDTVKDAARWADAVVDAAKPTKMAKAVDGTAIHKTYNPIQYAVVSGKKR